MGILKQPGQNWKPGRAHVNKPSGGGASHPHSGIYSLRLRGLFELTTVLDADAWNRWKELCGESLSKGLLGKVGTSTPGSNTNDLDFPADGRGDWEQRKDVPEGTPQISFRSYFDDFD